MTRMKRHLNIFVRRLTCFLRLSFKRKYLVVISILLLGVTRFAVLFVPFKKLASVMGEKMKDTPFDIDKESLRKAIIVGNIVTKTSLITPWQSKCLVQALAAQLILKRMKIPTTLYLGVCKNEPQNLEAHAWLRCGQQAITGGSQMPRFKEVMRFACYANQ